MSAARVPSSATVAIDAPDLRAGPPSSVHATFHGVVMLARVTDKAKAAAFGHLGDYTFNCPLDKAVFRFLEIDGEDYLRAIRAAHSQADIDAFIDTYTDRKSSAEIAAWNEKFIHYIPAPESDSWARLIRMRERYAPGREDIVNWADVLDLEEGRDVPLRTHAQA